MIIDTSAAFAPALERPIDAHLPAPLILRRDQLGGDIEDAARFFVVEPVDSIADVEAAVGFPLVIDDAPSWEWIERHEGGWIEIAFVFSDDGPADVLLVPDRTTIDPALADLLHRYAPAAHEATGTTTA